MRTRYFNGERVDVENRDGITCKPDGLKETFLY